MSGAAAAGPPRRDLPGYGIVLVSYLGMAGSAPLVAGLLVVLFGRGEGEASPAAAAEPEPL
jgi:hypothetical protein